MTRAFLHAWRLPVLAAVAATILLVAGVGMALYEEMLYSDQQIKDISEQAHILAASVTAAVVFDDQNAAQEYVDALKVNPELQAAAVYDRQGQLLAQFTRAAAPVPRHPPSQTGAVVANDSVAVLVPVTQRSENIGAVYLRAMTESSSRRNARYAGLILLICMGALVLAVLGYSQAALTRINAELQSRANQLSLVNTMLHDEMAERRKTEEALRQSHKMEAIGQLSGGIAHDFNNLITIVKGNLRLLRRKIAANGDTDRYFESAETGLDRAANLTQRILAFSRRQPLSPKPVQLSALVAGMHDLIHHSSGDGVKVQTELHAQWWTLCDVNQMENVVLNLAINARDAMPDGGTLAISTRDVTLNTPPEQLEGFLPGDYVELVLRDTGIGMSQETRLRAVDPFFTTKPQGKGTGLGLSMTFGYVRQSGGHLMIESVLGQGTAIVILMPRHEEPQKGDMA